MIRPSSLPMIAECPRFRGLPSDPEDDRTAGQKRHTALALFLEGKEAEALIGLDDADAEAIPWAAEQIRMHCPTMDYPLQIEQKRTWTRPDFSDATGTPDLVCGPVICDLKTRERDYTAQMADYALSVFAYGREFPSVKVYLLYSATKRVREMIFTPESAAAIVQKILDAAASDGTPKVCDYCGWCAEAFKCPAHLGQVETVAKGYTADPRVQSWHPSDMKTGEELAYALWLARKVIGPWCESVEFHAKEAALKSGQTLSCKVIEWGLKSKAGRKYCTDVATAFSLAGLEQKDFMLCCDLRIETSKKYPDKTGVANKYAGLHGMKLAPAKREILKKLESVIKQTPDIIMLSAVKAGAEETESE